MSIEKRIACVILMGFALAGHAAEIYVSPSGRAEGDGSLTRPYGSLPVAVNAMRRLRQSGYSQPVTIILREGRYQLNKTLVLGRADGAPVPSDPVTLPKYGSGRQSDPAHLTFAPYPGEQAVVSAGVPVTRWRRLTSAPSAVAKKAVGEVWVADMPAGMGRFYTLYDSKGRLKRARHTGFTVTKGGDRRTLHFPKGALKNWDNLEDVEINIRPSRAWVINMLPLASVDETLGVAKTSVAATYEMGPLPGWVHNPSGANAWVENILEALDEPGEWVVNTKTRKVYLWPSDPAPDGSPRRILAPSTAELIRVEGDIDTQGPADKPVRGIALSGLTFTHGDRRAWTSDEDRLGWGMQHDWDMFDRPTALLRLRGAEDCSVTDCRFVHTGGTGVRLDLHAQRNRIVDCEFAHLGEAGILLAGYGPGRKDVNHHNDIINNYIHHFSEITRHSPGIWCWQSGHNRMVHNELHHSGYSAVLITTRVTPNRGATSEGGMTIRHHEIEAQDKEGVIRTFANWKVREKYNHSRHNLFEYNEISHSVQLLSDGNAVYVSGTGAGNVIRYNFVHDHLAHSVTELIRCDDDQHETLIHGNVLYRNHSLLSAIASKGINDITNNVIVEPLAVPRLGYISLEWYPVTGSKIQRNVIVAHPDGGRPVVQRPRGANRPGPGGPELVSTNMDSNLYFHPTDANWADPHLIKLRAAGKETASLSGDPRFEDPAGGDFGFKEGSPAVTLGIETLDLSKMGRLQPGPVGPIEPTWESLAEHYQVPQWFVDGKLGVWFHWGIPSSIKEGRPHDGSHYGAWMYGTEGQLSAAKYPEAVQKLTDWHNETYGHYSEFGYEDLIPQFKAENWDPEALVRLVKDVGARFVMPVACHHDNFDMYDSFHPWNSVDMGPKRDTLKEWKAAAHRHGLKFGVSTHLYWSPRFFNSARKHQKADTLAWKLFNMDFSAKAYHADDAWNEHWYQRCWEIIEKYDPDMFNNDSPYPNLNSGKGLGIKLFTAFVNKDLHETGGKQSVVLSFKNPNQNREAFTYNMERGSAAQIESEPWMWATDLSGIWFYRDGARNRMSIPVMVGNAVDSISKNGVVMLNIALKGDGTIPDNQMAYLNAFRDMMKVNGEGIYGTRPWKVFGEGPLVIKAGRGSENLKRYCQQDIRFTLRRQGDGGQATETLYAFVLARPTSDIVIKTLAQGGLLDREIHKVTLLGSDETILWERSDEALTIRCPTSLPNTLAIGFRID